MITNPLALPASLQTILDAEYPRFSDEEMARRRAAIEALLKEADVRATLGIE